MFMRVGRGSGVLDPLDFEDFSKKGCFLNFEREKNKILHFWPPAGKILEKSLSVPRGKKPSDAHGPITQKTV